MTTINYDGRLFRVLQNVANGESSAETVFRYAQSGNILTATYEGGGVTHGYLLGAVDEGGRLDFHYMHRNAKGAVMTGHCSSTPSLRPDGTLLIHERWEWTSGDHSQGESMIEEFGRWR